MVSMGSLFHSLAISAMVLPCSGASFWFCTAHSRMDSGPGTDRHVHIGLCDRGDGQRRRGGVVSSVAVGHQIDVGLDIGEHAAHDIAFARPRFEKDFGAGFRYYVWHRLAGVFVRPEAHYYHVQNNQGFNSSNVFRLGASIGYTFGK